MTSTTRSKDPTENRDRPRIAPLRVDVQGGGPLASAIAARLAEGRMTVITSGAPVDVIVWAREEATFADALSANDAALAAGTPILFAIVEGHEIALGPLTVPGRTACLACAISPDFPRGTPIGAAPPGLLARIADDVFLALSQAASPDQRPTAILRERSQRSARGFVRPRAAWPRSGCAACAAARVVEGPFDLAAGLTLRGVAPSRSGGPPHHDAPRRRVGVIGGGTAGYLMALGLRRHRPDLHITLLESSKIPVIGVGEATTPDIVDFLLRTLGVDEAELYREVRPTWKLGIRFFWGDPGDYAFNHPFIGDHLLDGYALAGDQDLQSLSAQMMTKSLAPVLRGPNGKAIPLLATTPYAYHLDNPRFVRFLHKLAERAAIERIDCEIDDVRLAEDGSVASVHAKDGRDFSFDLYVDASGFRSLLMEKALGVPFVSWSKSLFCDTAVVADVPHHGHILPYTLAQSMDAGWCWNIPTPEENHRGYVHSSAFMSIDEAEAEMRRKNPGMGDARVVRFRSGRLSHCWVKNVYGVGNSFAFVEPLESTALHMIIHHVQMLVAAYPQGEGDMDAARARVNERVIAHWDQLRGFLALHHKFNRKFDTPFWRASRADVDLAAGEAMLAAYQEGAPLIARPDRELLEDSLLRDGFFGLLGVDNILLGQKVPCRMLTPRGDLAAFERWARYGMPAVLARAMPHAEALDAYHAWLAGDR